MEDRHLLIKLRQRLRLAVELLKPLLQNRNIVVVATNKRPIAKRTDRTLRKMCGAGAGGESAAATLQTARNSFANGLFRYLEPNGEVERRMMSFQDFLQTLPLRQSAGKSIEDKTVAAVQAQPIVDQSDNDFI